MVKQIFLTKDKVALVDDEDYDDLIKSKWAYFTHSYRNGNGYAYRTMEMPRVGGRRRKKTVYMHRVVMKDVPFDMVVDHIDGNGLNNQKANLRIVTQAENMKNQKNRKWGS